MIFGLLGGSGLMGEGIFRLLLERIVLQGITRVFVVETHVSLLERRKKCYLEWTRSFAERNINTLRKLYQKQESLISNREMIEAFIEQTWRCLHFASCLEVLSEADVILEAIPEDLKAKKELFARLATIKKEEALLCSNTSSIPLKELSSEPLLGLHFYNPSYRQPLVEVCEKGTKGKGALFAQFFGKEAVYTNDVAGFIGNGHFIRELAFALELVATVEHVNPFSYIDQITEKLLLRPMGIFRLVEFIGKETVQRIGHIMSVYLKEPALALGGLEEMPALTSMSFDAPSWKELSRDPAKQEKLEAFFAQQKESHLPEDRLAQNFLDKSKEIAYQLVKDGVTDSIDSVNLVLQKGFNHLYGV